MSEATRQCGGCTMCCKIMGIAELNKPRDQWCPHCSIGKGCQIYDSKPSSCSNFRCVWLDVPALSEKARPDREWAVMFTPDDGSESLHVHIDPRRESSWMKGEAGTFAMIWAQSGRPVLVTIGERRCALGTNEVLTQIKGALIKEKDSCTSDT